MCRQEWMATEIYGKTISWRGWGNLVTELVISHKLSKGIVFMKFTAAQFDGFFPLFPLDIAGLLFSNTFLSIARMLILIKNNMLDFAANTDSLCLHGPPCWVIWHLETQLLGLFPFKAWLRGLLHLRREGKGTIGGLISYTISQKALGISARIQLYQPEVPGAKRQSRDTEVNYCHQHRIFKL